MSKPSIPLAELEKLPSKPLFDSYVWVDYIELLCLFNIDQELSKADVADRYKERKGLGEGISTPQSEDLELEGETEDETACEQINSDENISNAERNDKKALRVEDWFRHLQFREQAFGDYYPFSLSQTQDVLQVKRPLTLKRKFYISLLLSSNLTYFKKYESKLTSSFELLSKRVLEKTLPITAKVHVFGSNPIHRHGRYQGNLWQKINLLAKDLYEHINADVTEEDFSPQDTGDQGLDVVAWFPFGDEVSPLLVVFGQSACTDKWVAKQRSSSYEVWKQVISLKALPHNMCFIPFCYRKVDGTWHSPHKVASVLVDRLRFRHVLRDDLNFWKLLPSYKVVDELLGKRQSIF